MYIPKLLNGGRANLIFPKEIKRTKSAPICPNLAKKGVCVILKKKPKKLKFKYLYEKSLDNFTISDYYKF